MQGKNIESKIELKHTNAGYKGIHIQFDFNGVKSEIQLHTKHGWDIKKKQDAIYQKIRDGKLSDIETAKLQNESIELGKQYQLSINDLTSFEVIPEVSTSAKSVLRVKSLISTQESPINSHPRTGLDLESNAYTRPDSPLRQNDENLSNSNAGITRGTNDLESADIKNPLNENNLDSTTNPPKTQETLENTDSKIESESTNKETKKFPQSALSERDIELGAESKKLLINSLNRATKDLNEIPNFATLDSKDKAKALRLQEKLQDLYDGTLQNIDKIQKPFLDLYKILGFNTKEAKAHFNRYNMFYKETDSTKSTPQNLESKTSLDSMESTPPKDSIESSNIEKIMRQQRALEDTLSLSTAKLPNFKSLDSKQKLAAGKIFAALKKEFRENGYENINTLQELFKDLDNALEMSKLGTWQVHDFLENIKQHYKDSIPTPRIIPKENKKQNLESSILHNLTGYKNLQHILDLENADALAKLRDVANILTSEDYNLSKYFLKSLDLNKTQINNKLKPLYNIDSSDILSLGKNLKSFFNRLQDKEMVRKIDNLMKDSIESTESKSLKETDSVSLESKSNKEIDSIESNVNKETKKSLQNDNVRKSKVTDMIINYTKELQNDLLAEYQKTGAPYTISDTYTKDRLLIMNKVFADSIKKYEANKLSYNDLNKLLDYMQDMYYFRELKYKNQGMPLDLYHYAFSDKSMMQYELKRRFPNGHIDYKMDFMEKEIESKPIVLKTQGIKNYKTLNSEFVESIAPILKKDIRNKETGIVAQISSTGVNKIKSKAAVDKSLENGFSKEEHFEVAKNLKELFEDSKYLRSEEPNNKSQDIKAVHRYGVNIDINDKQAQVLFTLKESVEHGNRIYSLELESIQRPQALKSVPEKQVDGLTNSVSFGGDAKSPIAENVNGNATQKIESLQDLEAIFKKNNTDSVNNELFDKVFSVAKDLKVEYSNEILGNKNILGQYNATNNKITLQDFSSETILHEMIHAVSSRAIDNPQVLKPVQKHAIKNLNRIYNRLKLDSKFKGEYALNSVKEMVAELSNPAFRDKLKSRNLWQRIIDSIANLFGFRKDSSNYAKISKNLSDIIDNYDTNFTKSYENANLESKNIDFAKKNTLESKSKFHKGGNLKDSKKDSKIKSDLLDKTKPLRMAKKEELTDELLKEAIRLDSKLWIGNLENKEIAKALGMDTSQPIKMTMRGSAMQHALKRHGIDSNLVKHSKQPPLDYKDIATHDNIVKDADMYGIIKNADGGYMLVGAKQINGYYAVVETISVKHNELKFKTEFKEKGELSVNSDIFKDAEDIVNSLGESLTRSSQGTRANLDTSLSTANKDSIKISPHLQDSKHIIDISDPNLPINRR